ncbi:unnamed protein product [marine sediment metagenome]|uniref:Uncharacterized protein n=1 Tax=marine sediment metagenome TaxID=412755 RepID=X1FZ08_9ZZZZ
MNKSDSILEDIHKIREELYEDTKKMDAKDEAIFYNKEAEKLLKNWGIELRKAEYLLETVR